MQRTRGTAAQGSAGPLAEDALPGPHRPHAVGLPGFPRASRGARGSAALVPHLLPPLPRHNRRVSTTAAPGWVAETGLCFCLSAGARGLGSGMLQLCTSRVERSTTQPSSPLRVSRMSLRSRPWGRQPRSSDGERRITPSSPTVLDSTLLQARRATRGTERGGGRHLGRRRSRCGPAVSPG